MKDIVPQLFEFCKSIPIPKQSTVLKVSIVIIGTPRYMGAFGALVGVNALTVAPWLIWAEVYSGMAMGVFEAFAIAFIFSRLSLLPNSSDDYKRLHIYAWLMVVLLPLVALPYLMASQLGLPVAQLFALGQLVAPLEFAYKGLLVLLLNGFGLALQLVWSLAALLVPVVSLMAIGYSDINPVEAQKIKLSQAADLKAFKQGLCIAQAEDEQKKIKPYACLNPGCKERFTKKLGRNGHMANCKHKLSEVPTAV